MQTVKRVILTVLGGIVLATLPLRQRMMAIRQNSGTETGSLCMTAAVIFPQVRLVTRYTPAVVMKTAVLWRLALVFGW